MFERLVRVFRLSNRVRALDRKCRKLQRDKHRSDKHLKRQIIEFNKLRESLHKRIEKTQVAMKNAQTVNDRLEESLSAVREELKTANEIVIPGLVAANQTFIDRWDAESRVHKLRMAIPAEPAAEGF